MKQITTADLQKTKESLLESMKKNFKNDISILPAVFIIAPNGEMTIIPTPYRNQNEKDAMMGAVRQLCKKINAVAVCIINEAWVRAIKSEDYDKVLKDMKETGKRISDYGDKKEVTLMMFQTKELSETITFDMDRVNRELINKISGETAGGDFANILSTTKK